jgi:hypothetical protein
VRQSKEALDKLIVTQLIKNLPESYGTWRLITVFATARHWNLSWTTWIQSTPSPSISLRSVFLLASHSRRNLLSGIFRSGLPTTVMCVSSSSSVTLQSRSDLGLPCGFHDSYSTMWVISSTIDLVLHTLIQTSETYSSNYQRLLWRSRETRVRSGRWILPTSTYRARRVL